MEEEILMTRAENDITSTKFFVGSVPTVYYIPEYITAAEEEQLLNNIYKAPISKWKSLKNRRLQNWGGVVHEKGLLAQDLPPWLKNVTHRICKESRLFPSEINHVLINEYLPDQGIMPHQDGPAYAPVVAILSLGSPVVMDFTPHSNLEKAASSNQETIISTEMTTSGEYPPFSVALMPRSLLIFKDKAYSDYLHGIKDSENQHYDKAVNVSDDWNLKSDGEAGSDAVFHRTGTRVSLTCRLVTKVRKHLIKL